MIRKITIEPVLNGYVCHVGCQTVVFQMRQQLLAELDGYLRAPDAVEKRYLAEAVNLPDLPNPAPCAAQLQTDGLGGLGVGITPR